MSISRPVVNVDELKLFDSPSHLFHITDGYYGKHVMLEPRDGGRSEDGEPALPRICTSDTIFGCCLALAGCLADEITVYVSRNPLRGYVPEHVYDSYATGERWLLKEEPFVHVGNLHGGFMHLFAFSSRLSWEYLVPHHPSSADPRRYVGEKGQWVKDILGHFPGLEFVSWRHRNWAFSYKPFELDACHDKGFPYSEFWIEGHFRKKVFNRQNTNVDTERKFQEKLQKVS